MEQILNLFDIPGNPFCNARVYLSGTFSVSKNTIGDKLESVGAIVRSIDAKGTKSWLGLSKDTCVIIAGNKQPDADIEKAEILLHDGFYIPIISEDECFSILAGNKQATFPKPIKSVDITYDFIFKSKVPTLLHFNFYEYTHPLGQKELFLHGIKGNKDLLYQSLGNIGAYSNFDFEPLSIDYCWLRNDTIENLKKGKKDEFIQIITNKYNSSPNNKFTYKFIVESEAIYWMLYRAKSIGDKLSLDYITRYIDSITR